MNIITFTSWYLQSHENKTLICLNRNYRASRKFLEGVQKEIQPKLINKKMYGDCGYLELKDTNSILRILPLAHCENALRGYRSHGVIIENYAAFDAKRNVLEPLLYREEKYYKNFVHLIEEGEFLYNSSDKGYIC